MFVRSLTTLSALLILQLPLSAAHGQTVAMESDQVPATAALTMTPQHYHSKVAGDGGVLGSRTTGSALGVDSVPNWSGYFYEPGIDQFGNGPIFAWTYTMVGSSPYGAAPATTIRAPVVPVNIDLRNYDGSPRYVNGHRLFYRVRHFVEPVMESPIFTSSTYDSSATPTQFTDAVQRAEFYNAAPPTWHTMLAPVVRESRTMTLIRGTYRFALDADGDCCKFVLVDINTFIGALFPATATDTTTPVGAAENAGDITTGDISSFLFPNTFLYFNGNPSQCCVIGFHSYDIEPGSAANGWLEKRYVLNYSSWISPGIFRDPTFGDISALSHELSETFNDPFTNNTTPWWLSANGNCQDNLEDGDVVEGLPNAQYSIESDDRTYHPQNEALLQWFAGVTPSTAIGGAYSYPDKTVLTAANVSQKFACTGPL